MLTKSRLRILAAGLELRSLSLIEFDHKNNRVFQAVERNFLCSSAQV